MLRFLPVGWIGLMLGGLVAANSSTILTHLNWGASYLVHDFYRRFINTTAPEHHYVTAGRISTVILFVAWSTGCITIWSGLFAVGKFLYGRTAIASALLAIFAVSSAVLIGVINRLWR